MSLPSMIRSPGGAPPASFANVGRRSMLVTSSFETLPAGIFAGQRAMQGTRAYNARKFLGAFHCFAAHLLAVKHTLASVHTDLCSATLHTPKRTEYLESSAIQHVVVVLWI